MKKIKIALGVISVLAAQLSFANPNETIDLNKGAVIEGGKTFKVSLKPLSDQAIYYDVTCQLSNGGTNDSIPFAFYPEKGAIGKTTINGNEIGSGANHTSTNLKQGPYTLVMTHVNRNDNVTLLLENGASEKTDGLLLSRCQAQSKN